MVKKHTILISHHEYKEDYNPKTYLHHWCKNCSKDCPICANIKLSRQVIVLEEASHGTPGI